MSVVYKYKDLAAMADYYENKAREERAAVDKTKPNRFVSIERRARAFVYESVAHQLRNTILEK